MTVTDSEEPVFHEQFLIKVFAKAETPIQNIVSQIIRKHAPQMQDIRWQIKTSRHQKYLAITATLYEIHQSALDAIYIDLSSREDVIMVL